MPKPGGKGKGAVAEPEEEILEEEPLKEEIPEEETPKPDDETPEEEEETPKPDDETPEEEEETPEEEPDHEKQELLDRIAALEEERDKRKESEKKEEPKPMSEDDWKKLEEDWGIAEKDGMPGMFGRKGVQQIIRLMTGMSQGFREMLATELGGFKKEAALTDLAQEKGFEDIKGYRKGIDEFLKDFDPKHHSDKNLLKKALTYARGLSASSKVKKALNSRQAERKVNKGGGHGLPGGKGGGKTITLTPEQKKSARDAKMSESEYIKYLTTDNLDDIPLPE